MRSRQCRQDAGLVLLAIAVRAAAVLILQSHHVPRSTYEHGEIAAHLLAGHGFSVRFLGARGPTSQQAPVYPALVALAYAVGGAETPAALLTLELAQAILGGLLVLGVLRLAREVAPHQRAVNIAAGLIAALHPTLVYAATHVQVSLLGATLLTWTLVCAFRTGVSGGSASALTTGALLAVVTLCDPILALGGAGALWAIVQGRSAQGRSRARAARLAALVVLTAAAGVTPWIVRNALVHGELVAIKSTFGYAFWQGNCALSEGTDKVVHASVEQVLDEEKSQSGLAALNRRLWAARHEAGYIDDIALTREDLELLGSVSEPERSRILFRRAIDELRDRPGRYWQLCLRRFRYFWLFDETNPKTRVWVYRVSHLALTMAALLGLGLATSDVRRRLRPTIVTVLSIALFHTLTIVSARFHIPLEPLLAVWAGAGLSRIEIERMPSRSAAARDHVVGVRLVRRLDRRELVHRLRLRGLPRAHQQDSQNQAGDQGAAADHERASPRNRDDRHVVGMGVGDADGGHPGRQHRGDGNTRPDRDHGPAARHPIGIGAGGRQAHLECSQPLLMVPLPFLLAVHQQDNRRHQNQRHHDAGQGDDQTFMHRFTPSADKPSSS